MTTGKMIAGFLLGTTMGIATGLLIAPTNGRQARKKIEKRSKKIAKQLAGYMGIETKLKGVGPKRRKAPVAV